MLRHDQTELCLMIKSIFREIIPFLTFYNVKSRAINR